MPEFTGVRVLDDFPLATLREFIDWTPFFHTWGLKGVYPRILEHAGQGAQARQIFAEANVLLDAIIAKKLITARGVYGFFPASAVGDDVELYADEARGEVLERFHFLRQQSNKEGSEPCRSLADFIAPKDNGACRFHWGFRGDKRDWSERAMRPVSIGERRLQRDYGGGHRRSSG